MMKKMLALALCSVLCVAILHAQSKVFKEVSDEISSQMRVITQDDALIGYLAFTRLEKASEDSFNYKISIMDENLNDMGSVNFREENLDLKAVSFEQDVLCLAYIKSNVIGNNYQNFKAYQRAADKAKHAVVTQFINLQGKILQTNAYNVAITTTETYGYTGSTFNAHVATGTLKHSLQLKNIGQKGFVCFYGDKNVNNLMSFSPSGKELWKTVVTDSKAFALLTSGADVYLLSKDEDKMLEGGYKVVGYNSFDGKDFAKHLLKDKKGNSLKVLDFENDPLSSKPVLTGYIINNSHGNKYGTAGHVTRGTYDGVFSVALNGHSKGEIKEIYSYWSDGTQSPSITSRGKFAENESYPRFSETVRDEKGNTYFIGSSFIKKTKWGAIGAAVVLAPLIVVSPMMIGLGGTQKYKVKDAMVLKQSANGNLSFDNSIACDDTRFYPHRTPVSLVDTKSFYTVFNANKKTSFLIVDDVKNIVIYNINSKKVVRTVPHKDGQVRTNIFPAKEGYIMVSEYNKKEKYTKLSIETL
jgi:hypothetical protein